MKKNHAYTLRDKMHKAVMSLSDDDAVEAVELFPCWKIGVEYAIDARVQYRDKLYRCIQAHVSQENWSPDIASALWVEIAKPGEIPVWKQPTGAHDAYRLGDKVHYPNKDDLVYESTIDYNTYEPGVYGWQLV